MRRDSWWRYGAGLGFHGDDADIRLGLGRRHGGRGWAIAARESQRKASHPQCSESRPRLSSIHES